VDTAGADLLTDQLDVADGPIERIDTHISTLVFQNGWVFKVKRPVHYEFVDLSTSEKRRRICEAELEQNRRFAPDVYDSLTPIRNADGVEVDCAVRMHRMPADRRLSTLVDRNDPGVPDHLRAVARIMAAAHARAERGATIDTVASPEALERLWMRSLDDMHKFVGTFVDGDTLTLVERRAVDYLRGRHDLLADRIARNLIVDGHGDLLANDIFCLDDGPRILDCLEFDERLRFGDVLADVAFLVMDLERLGHGELADRFVSDYIEFSDEHHPISLLHHYVAYRAVVRSKVACLRGADGDLAAASEARSLLQLAAKRLQLGEVTLVVVGGLPGSGKSTLADEISRETGWLVLSSDIIRKELAGQGAGPQPAAYKAGIYSPEMTNATYSAVFERAEIALRYGQSVIVDGSFTEQSYRMRAAELARVSTSRLLTLWCDAPAELREARLSRRPHDIAHPSDATVMIAQRMAEAVGPWADAHVIDTSGPVGRSLTTVIEALG
jgi:uncharacterized protein